MAAQAPYFQPPIPFMGPIYGGLQDGLMVIVTGSVLQKCTRFEVNFQCGFAQAPRPDIAFHFNPRFDEGGCVVWNSFERGSWQQEERQSSLPFRKGQPFEICFLVKSSSFMQSAAFQAGPYFQPQIYSVPYQVSLFGGLFPSKSIVVSGTVPLGANRFHINLKVGQDTAFHLNPRFNENVIVRNSNFHGQWGPEERHLPGGMPLHPGQTFAIWILCELKCLRVAVNGQHQFHYNHRVANLQQIDWLEIEGDVLLSGVQV